jgi:hypothetical protein
MKSYRALFPMQAPWWHGDTSIMLLLLGVCLPLPAVLVDAQPRALCFQLNSHRCCAAAAARTQTLPLRPAHALQQLETPALQQNICKQCVCGNDSRRSYPYMHAAC